MKKITDFIVNRRYAVLAFMLLVAAVCAFLATKVEIISDMTKYLPDDSNMKAGTDIMSEEFPDMETYQTIRVMFDDLTGTQKNEVLETLESIPYVHSVSYESDSKNYNRDNHTLYVLSTEYGYGTTEELSIESTLDQEFTSYSMIWENDAISASQFLPTWILIAAVAFMMVILFIMCGSWIEPILFLGVIGVAIVINLGTNLIMGSVSSVTSSIAAILQLALSMDYSIILINRYRQEKEQITDNKLAMKSALSNAFSSIASSSMTTVVGLLMLVFMSFKIGMDLGIVLAKGVFISMVCVLTMMPGVILACDKLIQKTAKKELHIPMEWAAGFSHRLRHVIGVLFVLFFIGVCYLQSQTDIAYTIQAEDPIAEIFPADNTLVMVYESSDEDGAAQLAEHLETDENIKSVMSYYTQISKPYTAEELAEKIADMGDSMALNASVIDMLYYDYYADGKMELMTAGEFLNFISDVVLKDETFADYIGEDMQENIDLIHRFAEPEELTKAMSAEELASFFDMNADDVKDLFLYYYIKNDSVPTGSMTLAAFTDFVVNEVAEDEAYGSMFDAGTLKQMEQLVLYTDTAKMTTPYNYQGIASLLGMDANTVKILFVYYYALSDSYTPAGMTLTDFVSYIQGDIVSDPTFGSYFDADTLKQMEQLALYTDANTVQRQMTPAELAGLLVMDESKVQQIFTMYYGQQAVNQGIPFAAFTNFLVNHVMGNPSYAGFFDETTKTQLIQMNQIASIAVGGQALTPAQLSQIVNMDKEMISNLFMFMTAQTGTVTESMTLPDFLNFLLNDVAANPLFAGQFDESAIAQLTLLQQMVNLAVSGQALTYQQMSKNLGMEESRIRQIYILYWGQNISGKTLSMNQAIEFLLSDSNMSAMLDEAARGQLAFLQTMLEASLSGRTFSYTEMGSLLGMDSSMVKMLYTYRESGSKANTWTLSMQAVINFLVNHSDQLGEVMGSENIAQLGMAQRIINSAVSGKSYSAGDLASLMGMDAEQTEQLYLLYTSRHGDTSKWTLSVKGFVDFLSSDILTNADFSDQFDTETANMLTTAKKLIDAVTAGRSYTAAEMSDLLAGFSEEMNGNTIELLYLYNSSTNSSNPTWTMSMETLLNYLVDTVLDDPRFASMIDTEMRNSLYDAQTSLTDGKAQLVAEKYSRLIITAGYAMESPETTAFIEDLSAWCENTLEGDFYLVGNSAMSYEMQQTFDNELLFITLLTDISIFLIVVLTFKSFFIPLILVLLVQGSVYATVSFAGVQGGSIFYLALLIVEGILMGATIDYGILFTNYYCESRRTMSVQSALRAAYAGATHTILTSGLILIFVTAIIANFFSEPTVTAIVKTISIGALCATLLILFVLPGLLAICDRFVIRKGKK